MTLTMRYRYAAIAFGRPCGIDDTDCEVPEIQAPKDAVTDMTYHVEKCRLYRVVGTFLGRRKESHQSGPVDKIHQRLRAWFSGLPDGLKVDFYMSNASPLSLVEMQALALQLAYDNIQVVLHRQAVFGVQQTERTQIRSTASVEQLVESALRTALAANHRAIIPICRSTHAAMHAGICLFTSGVVLSALYLANYTLSRFDELMPGLEGLIAFFRYFPGQHYQLATQSLHILLTLHDKCLQSEADDRDGSERVSNTTRAGELDGKICFFPPANSLALQSWQSLFSETQNGPPTGSHQTSPGKVQPPPAFSIWHPAAH